MENEVSAIELAVEKKKEICERAEAIANAEDLKDGSLRLGNLFDEWKQIRNYHSEEENLLWERFQKAREGYKAAREKQREARLQAKEELLKKAEAVLSMDNFKEASAVLSSITEELKNIGGCGKEADDAIWKRFNEYRDSFRKKRSEFIKLQESGRENAKKIKEELIGQAKLLSAIAEPDFKKVSDEMDELMNKWKEAGYAGREVNDSLWEAFSQARQGFFDKRKEAFKERDEQRETVVKAKLELIEKAKLLSQAMDVSAEKTQEMKALDESWKKAGNAGRAKENELWEAFSQARQPFWDEKHRIAREKEAEWKIKAKDIVKKKEKQIENLRKQIADLNNSIKNSTNWDRISTVRGWIGEKEAIIDELRKDIKKLEK